jgi:hypothetical protein
MPAEKITAVLTELRRTAGARVIPFRANGAS